MSSIQDSINMFSRSMSSLNAEIEIPKISQIELPRNYQLADRQYELLCTYIKDFQDGLDDEHEVCIKLASFGQSLLMQVTDIGYANPSLITFSGYVDAQYCELIQHINQLNFLIMSCPKATPEEPPRRIGFEIPCSDE